MTGGNHDRFDSDPTVTQQIDELIEHEQAQLNYFWSKLFFQPTLNVKIRFLRDLKNYINQKLYVLEQNDRLRISLAISDYIKQHSYQYSEKDLRTIISGYFSHKIRDFLEQYDCLKELTSRINDTSSEWLAKKWSHQ